MYPTLTPPSVGANYPIVVPSYGNSAFPSYGNSTLPSVAPSAPVGVPGSLGPVFAAATPVDPRPFEGAHPNVYFLSPSQNIGCYIFIGGGSRAECTIAHYNFPEPGQDCPQGALVSISEGATQSDVTCASTPVQPDPTKVLQYGQSVTNGSLACVSSQANLSCADITTGIGFTLSRDQYLPVG